MIIGIDIGGTNIDGVLIDENKILKELKNPVDKDNLFNTVKNALQKLTNGINKSNIDRINLSTTISTNSIIQGSNDEVLLIVQSGPGIQNDFSTRFKCLEEVSGYVDHRGIVIRPLDEDEIENIRNKPEYNKIDSLGVVTKFSTRNPDSEASIAAALERDFSYITQGHILSGNLNFPRRVNSTYLNSSVAKIFNGFLDDIRESLKREGIEAPIYILKADGGTMDIESSYNLPIQSILSGPAASFMGISALEDTVADSIYLDIGGTTTDIFFLVDGMPLFAPLGAEIGELKTLVRSVFSHSIGLGGDSVVRYEDGLLTIGPDRLGSPAILGGDYLTLTDAMSVLNLVDFGNRKKALKSIEDIAEKVNLTPEDTASIILEKAADIIYLTVERLLKKINSKPLYTVREVLENRQITPQEIKIIGGPADVLSPYIENRFNLKTKVTEHSKIANAIGAALARPTFEINLHADTASRILSIPEEDIYERISSGFTVEEGRDMVISALENQAASAGEKDCEVEIVEENVFNMVDGYSQGKNIRIKGQIRPGPLFTMRSDNSEDEK